MPKVMLIDATHPEETRVAVVDGRKLEELDLEIASRRPLKGNIYLAKVTRVEPSLQAAFVEYGGNRHGFLAFSEIHPDYYRIPISDREALIQEEIAEAEAEESAPPAEEILADDAAQPDGPSAETDESQSDAPALDTAESIPVDANLPETASEKTDATIMELEAPSAVLADRDFAETMPEESGENGEDAPAYSEIVEVAQPPEVIDVVGETTIESEDESGDAEQEDQARRRRQRHLKRYNIQEVVKRRQVMLIQVTKEERGNKGAALTTYLSLAGRYCVLMPNTDRGGGISRRITNVNDRKRLKSIIDGLDVPEGMAVIVRTAGFERSHEEIRRDFDYLLRLWDEIRETTLRSTAPTLIYEEASLIKRSIRDLYTRDIGDIIVAGDEGYRTAKSFMRMLSPDHAKRVQLYRDLSTPLFQRHQIESQIAAIHNPIVQLRSGGYIVINQTEALVAIDVNSGRATRERNIEETALRTNIEAAEEIARQLRLRDLAGLIVIDFIDMEENRNNATVERRFKEALKTDRARIQIGRISSFGLLEMSRQRLHPSLQEASTEACPHCRGSGRVRSVDSTALHVLRMIEEEITRNFSPGITVFVPGAVALYILNKKRQALSQLESRRGVRIYLSADESLTPPDYRLERLRALSPGEEIASAAESNEANFRAEDEFESAAAIADSAEAVAEDAAESRPTESVEATSGAEPMRRGHRRRRGRGGRFRADEFTEKTPAESAPGEADFAPSAPPSAAGDDAAANEGEAEISETEMRALPGESLEDQQRRRRRRGRRGGRRRRGRHQDMAALPENRAEGEEQPNLPTDLPADWAGEVPAPSARAAYPDGADAPAERAERPQRRPRRPYRSREMRGEAASAAPAEIEAPRANPRPKAQAESPAAATPSAPSASSTEGESEAPKRRGWWRRLME